MPENLACDPSARQLPTMTIIFVLGGTVLGTAILWLACGRLEKSAHQLSLHYGIPEVVQGSVLLAISSSVPELAVALLAFPVHNDFELGMSAIVGSAIYNILVIPAFSVFARKAPLRANSELVYREAQFYLVSVAALMVVLSLSVIYGGNGLPIAENAEGIIEGEFTPLLAVMPMILYGLYLFMQFEEVKDARKTTPRHEGINPVKEWAALAVTIAMILVGVEILLQVALTLADALQTPTFLWGMTVVAAATSLPDTFISVRASMSGRTQSSLSNVLGSNVFDLLVAVPFAVIITGAVTVNFTQIVPMMMFLMVATIVMLALMRRDWELTINEAWIMMLLYLSFGVWMALEAFGVTNTLGVR